MRPNAPLARVRVPLVAVLTLLWAIPSRADDPPSTPVAPEAKAASKPEGEKPQSPPGEQAAEKGASDKQVVQALPPKSTETGRFQFGSYGRIMASLDGRGGPGRDADIVSHGSRLDEDTYAELEFRREDSYFFVPDAPGVKTRIVATMAIGEPIFHATGKFDAKLALRNLYLEEKGIGSEHLAVWAGSRMYRGDDAYLLNWWPLDNLNTVGGGARLNLPSRTEIALHMGANVLDNPFQSQYGVRALPNNQVGTTQIAVLKRPRTIESLRLEQILPALGEKGGVKGVLYGELHQLPSGQREREPGRYEELSSDSGFVAGAQLGMFTGERDTHVNLFLRYARGIAAFGGDLAVPSPLDASRTSGSSNELSIALSGNFEAGPFTVMGAGYFRRFRSSSPDQFSYANINEGALVVRPHVYFTDTVGVFVEGTVEALQRGVLDATGKKPLGGSLYRFGVVPFLSPAGKGSYTRPQLRLIWLFTKRDEGARSLYPSDDIFARRPVEQFFGLEAEWWFNSSYR